MKKLISSLTALTLSVVSAVPMFSNALGKMVDYEDNGMDYVVADVFGEEAIVEYRPENIFYFVMSPEKFGSIMGPDEQLVVKLKADSEFDEESLNNFVNEECTTFATCYKDAENDNTYIFGNNKIMDRSSRIAMYHEIADFLSQHEDVVSIRQRNLFDVNTGGLFNFEIMVSGDVDFDCEEYSDYVVKYNEVYGIAPAYWRILSPLADYGHDYEYFIETTNVKDGFYEDMYNTFLKLQEEYGKENVKMLYTSLESTSSSSQEYCVYDNLYTALITGDTNADGGIDIADALAIASYVGDPSENQLNESSLTNADVNGDGFVDTIDILVIQQYLAGIITEL